MKESRVRWVNRKTGSAIHVLGKKYVLVICPSAPILVFDKLRDLLKYYYRRLVTYWFDTGGNLWVRYEEEVHSGGYFVDYCQETDLWRKMS